MPRHCTATFDHRIATVFFSTKLAARRKKNYCLINSSDNRTNMKHHSGLQIRRPSRQLRLFLFLLLSFVDKSVVAQERLGTRVQEARPTFEGGVMYPDIAQGLIDMWSASGAFKDGRRENLGLFTRQGLLVLPNTKNTKDNSVASLSFFSLRFVDNRPQINWGGKDNWLPILGVVHTHPDPSGYQQHAAYWECPGEWLWTKAGLSHFVVATTGVYEGKYNGTDYVSHFVSQESLKSEGLQASMVASVYKNAKWTLNVAANAIRRQALISSIDPDTIN
jgi:hypothetical protein